MARNKKRTRIIRINAPKHFDPGKGRPVEELAYISPREKARLLGSTDHKAEMTKHGILSFADDSASSTGMSRGDASQGTVGADNRASTASSPQASRGSAIGSSTSRASQSNIGGSQSNASASGSSSSHASASNRSSPGGSGGQSTGGQNTAGGRQGGQNTGGQNTGGRGNEAGGVGAQSGGSRPAGGTPTGGNQPSSRTPGGGAQPSSGALGQMARSKAPGTRTPGGGAPPASGMLGQLAGPPRAPGSAMGLLGATRSPQKMQDRIAPSRGSEEGSYPVGTFDPAKPVGRPGALFGTPHGWDEGMQDPYSELKGKGNFLGATPPSGESNIPGYNDPNIGAFPALGDEEMRVRGYEDVEPEAYFDVPELLQDLRKPPTPHELEMIEDLRGVRPPITFDPDMDLMNYAMPVGTPPKIQDRIAPTYEYEPKQITDRISPYDSFTPEEDAVFNGILAGTLPVNLRDPVSTGGLILGQKTSQPGIAEPEDFGVIPGESPFGNERLFGDPVEDTGPRINPAGGTPKTIDRVAPDPNYNPQEGTYNPATGRVDFSPEQRSRIDRGNQLLGTTPLNDIPTNFTGLLGVAPKPIQDRLSPEPTVPKEIQDRIAPSLAGILSPRTRPDLSQDEIEQAPEASPEDIYSQINNPARVFPGRPVGLPRSTTGVLSPPTRGPIPGYTPTLPSTTGVLSPPTRGPIPGYEPSIPIPREKPPSLANTPFPGRSRVNPMLGQDTEPETAPTDITQYGSWPENLPLSSGMPQGTLRDRLIQDAVAEDEGREPANISPEIPVNVRVKNSVVKQYGPDMATEILTTVAAIKQAMGYGTKGGAQKGRGRGIGQLAMAPKQKRIPLTGTGHATRFIPPDAPLLEA